MRSTASAQAVKRAVLQLKEASVNLLVIRGCVGLPVGLQDCIDMVREKGSGLVFDVFSILGRVRRGQSGEHVWPVC